MKKWLQERERFRKEESWRRFAVSVIIETPKGIPILFLQRRFTLIHGNTKFAFSLKFPGGNGQVGEAPTEAAVREIREELGIQLNPKSLQQLYFEPRGNHDFFIFGASSLAEPTKKMTDDQEIVGVFAPDTLKRYLPCFLPAHQEAAERKLYFIGKQRNYSCRAG